MLLVACLLAAWPVELEANPLENFGFGSRWVALGGAVTAMVDDVGAIYYNPAGVVLAERVQFMLGYFHASPSLKINGYDIGEDSVAGIVGGVITPPMKVGPFKFGGGAAIHIPDKRVARTLAIPYDQPTFVHFGARNQRMVAQFPFAIEIFPWLQVGASISMFVRTGGGPDFILRENRPGNEGLSSEGSISASQKPRFYPTAGVMAHPTKRIHLGFAYRGKNEVLYKVPLRVTIEPLHIFSFLPFPLLGESLIDLNQYVFTFFSPEEFSFGAAFNITENLTVGLDLTLDRWSAFKQPAPEGATVYSGGLAQLLPPNPNYPLPPPNYSDILTPALGVEYRAFSRGGWEIYVRGGYRFRPNPAPQAQGWNNFLDNDTHIFSGGLGVQFLDVEKALRVMRGPIRLDVHVQYFWLTEGEALKVNPVADAYADMVYGGNVLNLGTTLTLEF